MFNKLGKFTACMAFFVMIFTFGFTACQDLGDVDTEEDYYALYPTVTMIANDQVDEADMEDLYNKETSENITSPFEVDKEYSFMVIEVDPPSGKVLTCDSVAMYLLYSGDHNVTLDAYCFVGQQELLEKVKNPEIPFDETSETEMGRASVTLKAIIDSPNAKQPQNSFVLSFTRTRFETSGYIVIMFKRKTAESISFRPTNVMVHTNSIVDGD